jgi:hemoglobin
MRNLRRQFGAIFILAAAFLAVCAPSFAQSDRDLIDNKAIDQRYIDAYTHLDATAMMSLYANSPDLVVVFPDGTQVRSWNDVRMGYTAFFSQYSQMRGELTETNYVQTSDGMLGFGKGYLYMTSRNGIGEQRLDFRYTNYRVKRGGVWTLTVDTIQAVAYQPLPTDNLYTRLGGYDVISQVADDFVQRTLADPQLSMYFANIDDKGQKQMRQRAIDAIASATGGPVVYVPTGSAPASNAAAMGDIVWQHALQNLAVTCDKFRLPARERGELTQLVSGMKAQILGR